MVVAEMDEEVEVEAKLAQKLEALDEAVGYENELEIDGVMEEEGVEGIKIINLTRKEAYFVPVEVIATTPLRDLIKALLSGDGERTCIAYSRIVGYYSRISNWNDSKKSELISRSRGNYFEHKRVLDKDTQEAFNRM